MHQTRSRDSEAVEASPTSLVPIPFAENSMIDPTKESITTL